MRHSTIPPEQLELRFESLPPDFQRIGLVDINPYPRYAESRKDAQQPGLPREWLEKKPWHTHALVEMCPPNSYPAVVARCRTLPDFQGLGIPLPSLVTEAISRPLTPTPAASLCLSPPPVAEIECLWLLRDPVHLNPDSSSRALERYLRVDAFFQERLGALENDDLFRSPVAEAHTGKPDGLYEGRPGVHAEHGGYYLGDLASVIPKGWRRSGTSLAARRQRVTRRVICELGLNPQRWALPLSLAEHYARTANERLASPLPPHWVQQAANDGYRWHRRQLESGQVQERYAGDQRRQGLKSGQVRQGQVEGRNSQIREARQTLSTNRTAQLFGVSRRQVQRVTGTQ